MHSISRYNYSICKNFVNIIIIFIIQGTSEVNRIYVGISIFHFYLFAKEKGLRGEIKVLGHKSGIRCSMDSMTNITK